MIDQPNHHRGPDQPGNHPDQNSPVIRAASPDEAAAVLDLWGRAGAAPSRTDDVDSIAAVAATGALLVATADAVEPAGTEPVVVGTLIAAWDGWRGNLYRLAVDPDHRRRGIAAALVIGGEQHLQAQGCVRISALVLDDVDHATGFWRAAGYELQPEIGRWTSTLPES